MVEKIKSNLKKIIYIIRKPVMSILPGQLAFSFVLSIIPILAIIGIIGYSFSFSISNLSKFVSDTFPSSASNLLLPLINGKGFDANIVIFLISALLLASGGAFSIITTADILYDIEQPHALKKRIKSYIITFMLITLMCFLIIVPAYGDYIINLLKDLKFIKGFSDIITTGYIIIKYPLTFIFIYFMIKLIYTISPDKKIESKTVTAGSVFTTVLWVIVTQIYSYYVGNVVHYDIFYGSLSNIIILLFWMYILAYVFVVGLALNAEKYRISSNEQNNIERL